MIKVNRRKKELGSMSKSYRLNLLCKSYSNMLGTEDEEGKCIYSAEVLESYSKQIDILENEIEQERLSNMRLAKVINQGLKIDETKVDDEEDFEELDLDEVIKLKFI